MPESPANHAEPDPLLANLTEPQRRAVTHVEGPLLVLAGPGSGKTRVITHRVAYLVLRVGLAPWNILAITFTNKAAGEMRQRVSQLVSERQARALTVATFHSLCARLLRQYADRLGLPPGYSIYDTADQTRAMKRAIEALEVNATNFPPGRVLSTISNAKNELIDEDAYAQSAGDFYTKTVAKIYRKYQELLLQSNALDFDDLMVKTVLLLRKHPDVLAQLRERFAYVLIDEYQDTNHAQFVIANLLAGGHKNICATGDPDQSIYGWRGANIRNILEFETHYPDATVVRLEQNYRSTKNILAAADRLIQHNRQRRHKSLWTDNEAGEPVRCVTLHDERAEARHVVDTFQRLHDEQNIPWRSMAVFYRINSLSRVVEDAFREAVVPYQVARGTAFYERKEVKDAIAYLRVIANPADEVNLTRIVNLPARGVSDATVKQLQTQAVLLNTNLFDAMSRPLPPALNARAVGAVQRFVKMIDTLRLHAGLTAQPPPDEAQDMTLRFFVETVLRESGLEDYYRNDKSDPDQERLANLGELVSSAQQYEQELAEIEQTEGGVEPMTLAEKLEGYLERVSLVSDVDSVDSDQGAVTLMTLHAAKGLEYAAVAIVGFEEGLLPHSRAKEDVSELEEERRLAFVGITRAMRTLWLTHAKLRTVFGQTLPTIPSRFLRELPQEAIEQEDRSLGAGFGVSDQELDRSFALGSQQRAAAAREVGEFPPGTKVRHPQFGLGTVVSVTSIGAQTRAKVHFNAFGTKTLVLQYARLEKVAGRPDV